MGNGPGVLKVKKKGRKRLVKWAGGSQEEEKEADSIKTSIMQSYSTSWCAMGKRSGRTPCFVLGTLLLLMILPTISASQLPFFSIESSIVFPLKKEKIFLVGFICDVNSNFLKTNGSDYIKAQKGSERAKMMIIIIKFASRLFWRRLAQNAFA